MDADGPLLGAGRDIFGYDAVDAVGVALVEDRAQRQLRAEGIAHRRTGNRRRQPSSGSRALFRAGRRARPPATAT
jgi:hypothetical protein